MTKPKAKAAVIRKRAGAPAPAPAVAAAPGLPVIHTAFLIAIADLKPHPRNYKEHPDDQLSHLGQSMQDNGVYRNVVLARDNTLLAGHGVVMAAQRRGLAQVPAVRLDIAPDSPEALKVMTGDNEVMHLGITDDRKLTDLLKELYDSNEDKGTALVGTGYDAAMLAAQAMVTRPESEIRDFNAAAEWVGLPECLPRVEPPKAMVLFLTLADREAFGKLIGQELTGERPTLSIWWPAKEKEDVATLEIEG